MAGRLRRHTCRIYGFSSAIRYFILGIVLNFVRKVQQRCAIIPVFHTIAPQKSPLNRSLLLFRKRKRSHTYDFLLLLSFCVHAAQNGRPVWEPSVLPCDAQDAPSLPKSPPAAVWLPFLFSGSGERFRFTRSVQSPRRRDCRAGRRNQPAASRPRIHNRRPCTPSPSSVRRPWAASA